MIHFTSKDFDTSNIDKGKDEIIENEKVKISLTTVQNQKNNVNYNISRIDLGECEYILREYYNISNNTTLYMKKIDVKQEGYKIPKIEFDVYCKLSGLNLEKLNLSICENTKINIYIPIDISENLDKFNSSSGYYNDICYTTTSESGTDISLKDRKNEFITQNRTTCQDGCDFSEYDYTTKNAKCSCNVKESSSSIANIIINKNKLFESFIDFKNIANINILRCYKTLFSIQGIIKNIGFYIIIIIILIHTINIIIFYICQISMIKKTIKKIIFGIKHLNFLDKKENKEETINDNNKKEIDGNNSDANNEIIRFTRTNNSSKRKKKRKHNRNKNKMKEKNSLNNANDKLDKIFKKGIIKREVISRIIEKIMKYNDDEMNDLSYDSAIKIDKRNFWQYYISLLKTKHDFLFTFCNNDDYNSKILKIDTFFIGFTIFYTINALFFDDENIHNIYINEGAFDFLYQLPEIIYSSLISFILNTIIKILALSSDDISDFKKNKSKQDIKDRAKILRKKLRIKFIFYFIISFIFLLFFLYYLSMFGAIYKNTQYHLLKDTLISFALSFLSPFGIYLLPGLFRISALSDNNKKRICIYNFSKFLQSVF